MIVIIILEPVILHTPSFHLCWYNFLKIKIIFKNSISVSALQHGSIEPWEEHSQRSLSRQLYLPIHFTQAESTNEWHSTGPPDKRAPISWAKTVLYAKRGVYYVISVVIIIFWFVLSGFIQVPDHAMYSLSFVIIQISSQLITPNFYIFPISLKFCYMYVSKCA